MAARYRFRRLKPFEKQRIKTKLFHPAALVYVESFHSPQHAKKRSQEIRRKSKRPPSLEYGKNCNLNFHFVSGNKVYIFVQGLGETFYLKVKRLFHKNIPSD